MRWSSFVRLGRRFGASPYRRDFAVVLVAFVGLGFHVGVQAVLLADLSGALGLRPAELGAALSAQAAAGIAALVAGGRVADRIGRRPFLVVGAGGVGLFFLALAGLRGSAVVVVAFVAGGICASAYDLAVNALGGDVERRHRSRTMQFFHAGFSGGAAAGAALTAGALHLGVGFRAVYAGAGVLLLGLGLAGAALPLPSRSGEGGVGKDALEVGPLWRAPGVRLAIVLVALCFFGDGALEGFTSLFLRDLLGSGALLGGLGIAAFHLTGLAGRLVGGVAARRWGERRVVEAAGAAATGGMALALATTDPRVAVAGLLLVGFGLSPVVPTAFSLAGRAAPGRGARAVSLVTTVGYAAFVVAPLAVGGLADLASLRAALLPLVGTYAAVSLLARRIPVTEVNEALAGAGTDDADAFP